MTTEAEVPAMPLAPRQSVVQLTGSEGDAVETGEKLGLLRLVASLKTSVDRLAQENKDLRNQSANYKNSWEQARSRVKDLEAEPEKLRQHIESIRGELRRAQENSKGMVKSLSEAGAESMSLRRRVAQAESSFAAFKPTAEKIQRARDAAIAARDKAVLDQENLRRDLEETKAKLEDSKTIQQDLRSLLAQVRAVMPADLDQVKNEVFRRLLVEIEHRGFRPLQKAKA